MDGFFGDEPGFQPNVQTQTNLAGALAERLALFGVRHAFGVIGGAIGVLYDALEDSRITLHHFRHESGAAFAAAEAYFATDHPSVVFVTTGPGTLNALTGIAAARWDGAKVVLLSGTTGAAQRGRWATQESSAYTLPQDALYSRGPIFDFGVRVEHASELTEVLRRLRHGLARPNGFIAHIGLPISLQSARVELPRAPRPTGLVSSAIAEDRAAECAQLLTEDGPFAIWVGFGARSASAQVRELMRRTGAHAFCSPRGKGIISETHPRFVGVSGLGGHESVRDFMLHEQPAWVLVLGSRLGESTSFWDTALCPSSGFIHVDLDPNVPGVAYPTVHTMAVQSEIGHFLDRLLEALPTDDPTRALPTPSTFRHEAEPIPRAGQHLTPVRPQVLMAALQRGVIDATDALIMSESGNAFAWCNHHLRFQEPGRYRVSTLFGSMGHCASGIVGAALASGRKTVGVVGDGAMLMNAEVSTAVQYDAPVVWVILNDAGFGMSESGQQMFGLSTAQLRYNQVDFVAIARATGADGVRVTHEDQLDDALARAMAAKGPFVVDVIIDPSEASPLISRFESLLRQGSASDIAAWDA
ncbi:MAG: thiamine pyrophosphate-dependent enzyme [Acidobacteriota bacterium]